MKKIFKILILAVATLSFVSCSDDGGNLGEALLGKDQVFVRSDSSSKILVDVNINNNDDLSGIGTSLIGTLNDTELGQTNVGSAFQLRIKGKLVTINPSVDSVKLFLNYKKHYGADLNLHQKVRVYKLTKDLDDEKSYSSSFDIKSILGDEVGSKSFNKKMVSDTIYLKSKLNPEQDSVVDGVKVIDTILKYLVIDLDKNKIGTMLLDGNETDYANAENFTKFFKGLYLKAEEVSPSVSEGLIYGFNVYQSYMKLYFKDQTSKSDKTREKYEFNYFITDNSARFNHPIFKIKKDAISTKDKIYLAGIHGTKAKITIPSINSWKGKGDITINDAKLIFTAVKQSKLEMEKYPLPKCLELSVVDESGKRHFLHSSYTVNRNIKINGLLNTKKSTYVFNIPEYMQSIVDGNSKYKYFELSMAGIEFNKDKQGYLIGAKNSPARVILYNSGENKPRFEITYTEL